MRTVRVMDVATRQITTIPATELAPGMIKARIPDIGEVFVPASQVNVSTEFRHGPFDEGILTILRRIQATFADVRPLSLKEWEDGFRCDMNPEKEIAIWVIMAQLYRRFTKHLTPGPSDPDKKQDIYRLILACFNNGPQNASATFSARTLSRRRVAEIIEYISDPTKWPKDDNEDEVAPE